MHGRQGVFLQFDVVVITERVESDRVIVLVLQAVVRTDTQTLERVVVVPFHRESDIIIGRIAVTCRYRDTGLTVDTTGGHADLLELVSGNRSDLRQDGRSDRQFVRIVRHIRCETDHRHAADLQTGKSRDLRFSGGENEFIDRLVGAVSCQDGDTGCSIDTAIINSDRLVLVTRGIKDVR